MDKQTIREAVLREKSRLGSQRAVAKKCGLNESYISQIITGNHATLLDEHWAQVARALDLLASDWRDVPTNDRRAALGILEAAKQRALFVAVASPAGGGKTAACRQYRDDNAHRAVFYYRVEHPNMGKTEFLKRLGAALGIEQKQGAYLNANGLADAIIGFFTERLGERPMLVVDEADKLGDKALGFFISLYNIVEGKMGCAILGTEHLEKRIKSGVQWQRNGFDELDSRFGRRYIRLDGATLNEVRQICEANGIADRDAQKQIFEECSPVRIMLGGQSVSVLKDLRPLRRKIEREKMMGAQQQVEAAGG